MDRFLHLNLSFLRCRNHREVLAFCWFAGLLLGSFLSKTVCNAFALSIYAVDYSCPDFFSLNVLLQFPLFLSFIVVYFRKFWLLYFLAFLKSFLFSFTATGCIYAFGSAGWLAYGLIMFADLVALPSIWWFWLQAVCKNTKCILHSSIVATFSILLIGCFYYFTIAPFLENLILF